MPMQLRDYQSGYIESVRQAYRDGFKAPCVVAPCGAGKSIIIGSIAKQTADKGNRVLFLVHRKELCDQIEETFTRIGIPKAQYKIGMVQTLVRCLDRIEKPALIITDENHHALAASYRKIYDYFPDVLKLGFTATPIRLNGSGLGDVNDVLIEEVTAKWLIENKFLAPYIYYAPKLIDDNKLKLNNLKEFSDQSITEAMQEKTIFGDVIRHYEKLADGGQAIAYCHNIAASKETAGAFQAHGINAVHIDAKTPKAERDAVIKKFREGEIKILCNVDLIGEGFDVPDCSTVIMLRPTQSLSLYIQQSMRGMRYKPNKVSVIIDHVDNISRHGPPDMEREWDLKGKKKKQELDIKIKQCLNCFAVYDPKESKCPLCGYAPKVEEKETQYEYDEAAELEKIDTDNFVFKLEHPKATPPEECTSYAGLLEYAKEVGRKPAWAAIQARERGFADTPQWVKSWNK